MRGFRVTWFHLLMGSLSVIFRLTNGSIKVNTLIRNRLVVKPNIGSGYVYVCCLSLKSSTHKEVVECMYVKSNEYSDTTVNYTVSDFYRLGILFTVYRIWVYSQIVFIFIFVQLVNFSEYFSFFFFLWS